MGRSTHLKEKIKAGKIRMWAWRWLGFFRRIFFILGGFNRFSEWAPKHLKVCLYSTIFIAVFVNFLEHFLASSGAKSRDNVNYLKDKLMYVLINSSILKGRIFNMILSQIFSSLLQKSWLVLRQWQLIKTNFWLLWR